MDSICEKGALTVRDPYGKLNAIGKEVMRMDDQRTYSAHSPLFEVAVS